MRLRRVGDHDLPLPCRATEKAAGFDLQTTKGFAIPDGGGVVLVNTGFAWEIPENYVGLICPRSGLAKDYKITVLNSPGVIDADYRGEVKVLLISHSNRILRFAKGDRIAQMVVMPVAMMELEESNWLAATHRGMEGFGSTGL